MCLCTQVSVLYTLSTVCRQTLHSANTCFLFFLFHLICLSVCLSVCLSLSLSKRRNFLRQQLRWGMEGGRGCSLEFVNISGSTLPNYWLPTVVAVFVENSRDWVSHETFCRPPPPFPFPTLTHPSAHPPSPTHPSAHPPSPPPQPTK